MFDNTASVWKFARPRLAGRWWRVEVVTPDGFPDVVGVRRGKVHFIEIKANGDTMRPSQIIFLGDCIADGASVFILAARGARLAWFQDVECAREITPPDFYRSP